MAAGGSHGLASELPHWYPRLVDLSFEFRTFWWYGELVGWGRSWWQGRPYSLKAQEERDMLAVAREAVRRLAVPFLVVDVAQEVTGYWLVIECSDGQESDSAGLFPSPSGRTSWPRSARGPDSRYKPPPACAC